MARPAVVIKAACAWGLPETWTVARVSGLHIQYDREAWTLASEVCAKQLRDLHSASKVLTLGHNKHSVCVGFGIRAQVWALSSRIQEPPNTFLGSPNSPNSRSR